MIGKRYLYVKSNNSVEEIRRLQKEQSENIDGGPEAYLRYFADYSKGSPTLVISTHDRPLEDEYIESGDIAAKSFYWPTPLTFPNLWKQMAIVARMMKMIVGFQPTHIYCWQLQLPLWCTFLGAKIRRCKFVVSVHTSITSNGPRLRHRVRAQIDNMIFRNADVVLCHGPYIHDCLRSIGVNESRIIEFNWGYAHLARSIGEGSRSFFGDDKKILLFSGRLIRGKGIFDLFEGTAGLLKANSKLFLVYAGEGSDREELERLVDASGLKGSVCILGRISQRELAVLLSKSWVVVTPTQSTLSEGRCMAAIEALVLGVPVVAPDFGAFRYIVSHESNGLLFEPDSVPALRRCLERLLVEPMRYRKLREGAGKSGIEFANPKVHFRDALRLALE